MKQRHMPSSLIAAALFTAALGPSADAAAVKQALRTNYQVVYGQTPGSVESPGSMFSEGMFYGRLRSNSFYNRWEEETSSQKNHIASGLGGSLIYKSAKFSGFDMTGGLYYSRGFYRIDNDDVSGLKKGKDVFSRFDYTNTGSKSMGVLGQAYLRYSGIAKTQIKVGRQIVETFYTKSNDSKMIPNTFDGIVVATKSLPGSTVRLAYLYAQKLREHTRSHSVLAYGDANATSSENPAWSRNDDSAMHKGLTYTRLKAAGADTDAPLITGDIRNKPVKDLTLGLSFYTVPQLLSEVMAEANYKIAMDGFTLTPGVRYIRQFDDGAGEIGGAAYSGSLAGQSGKSGGYEDAGSLDAQMIAARLVARIKNYKINLGYTNVLDEADLITPWRGFPTAGYTRSMARYNWQANTKSYRIELVRNGNPKGVYQELFMQFSVLHTDADESKGYFDEDYYYAGFVQNIPGLVTLQWRLRLGYNDTDKAGADDLDARLELNYLF